MKFRAGMSMRRLMSISLCKLLSLTMVAVVFVCSGNRSFAQSTGQAQAPDDSAQLQEIVVTAEKREVNLQKLPIVVTALGEDQLNNAGVHEFANLDKVAPEVRIDEVVSMARVEIRGIATTNLGPSSETLNAVYLNGAFLPKSSSLGGQFFDIERIEVLSGPQGTLFGRNSMGGAINIIPKLPGKEFAVDTELELGNFNLQRAMAAVDVPITDSLSMRFAVNSLRHSGYFDNGLGDADEHSVRWSTVWTPDDVQRVLFTFDLESLNNRSYGVFMPLRSPDPRTVIPNAFNATSVYGSDPPFYGRSNQPGFTLQYDLSMPWATLTAQAAHRQQKESDFDATLGTTLNPSGQFVPTAYSHDAEIRMTSLEARLTSIETNPLAWIFGLYTSRINDSGFLNFFSSVPIHASDEPLVSEGNSYELARDYAIFAQGMYTPKALEALHITIGGRYTVDNKHATTETFGLLEPAPYSYDGSKTWQGPTARFALSYDLSPESLVYTSASRGYSTGGFAFGPPGQVPEYKQESVWSYEIGSKNRFFDNKLQVNADVYYMSYKNLDTVYTYAIPTLAGPPILTIGIASGDTTYKGASLAIEYLITPHDHLAASGNWLHAIYGDFDETKYADSIADPTQRAIAASQLYQLNGTPVPTAAPWTANASYDHDWPFALYSFDAQVAAQYRDATVAYTQFQNTPYYFSGKQPEILRFDLNFRFGRRDSKWNATAYVHNVANAVDYAQVAGSSSQPGVESGQPIVPRTFGLFMTTHF